MVVHEQGHDAPAVSVAALSEIDCPVKKQGHRSVARRPHAALLRSSYINVFIYSTKQNKPLYSTM